MRTLKYLAGLTLGVSACAVGYAGGPKTGVEAVAEVRSGRMFADRAAQVVPLGEGRYRMVKPWTVVGPTSRANGVCSLGEAFDSLDVLWTPKGPGADLDPNYAAYFDDLLTGNANRCNEAAAPIGNTARWRLRYTNPPTPVHLYDNPHSLDDMEITNPSANGANSYEMAFAYSIQYQAIPNPIPNPPTLFFIISHWDAISDDPNFCNFDPNDPNAAVGDFLGGVILGFDDPAGTANNHIEFIANLCGNPEDIHWTLPNGRGAIEVLHASDAVEDPNDPNIIIVTVGRGQQMLWFGENNSATSVWDLDGDQGSIKYDDDGGVAAPPAIVDGVFDPFTECFGYIFAIPQQCPGNRDNEGLGSPIPAGNERINWGYSMLYGNAGGPQCSCTGDIAPSGNPNGVVDINDLTLLLSNFGLVPTDPCVDVNNSGGAIDINDLTALLSAFGSTCP